MIRPEQPSDVPAIHALVEAAFAAAPHAGDDEQDLVDRLRANGELALSLVAVDDAGTVIGHIGFSPVTIGGRDCGWFQMAPVSVAPERQRQGIGRALIEGGIAEMRRRGASGIGVVGDPGYYERFGFVRVKGLGPAGEEAEYFRALVFHGVQPPGVLRYASAFG